MGQWITVSGKPKYIYNHQFIFCHECGDLLEAEDKDITVNNEPSIVPHTNGESKYLCEPCVEMYKEEDMVQYEDYDTH